MSVDDRQAYLRELGLTLWERWSAAGGYPPADRADVAVAEPPAAPAPERHGGEKAPPEPAPAPSTATVEAGARAPAPEADIARMDWEALEADLARQDHRGASRPVFGVGARDADLLIVGEAPGAEEDRRGEPFVGRAGKLLDRMLFAIGRSRSKNAYIANICKFRPPNNRDPNPDEVAADRPYLERQIDLLSPRLIIAVGRVAAQNLLGTDQSLGRLRGRLHDYPRRDIPVLVTYHPAYLLRSPQQKARAWEDLKRAAALLEASP
ncbi:phage DNA polymerase-like protein [Salinisphaera sp. PC39]|uniref:uracil-DNA glycosylase n=1 Tax=Salinisphaera sp. PC39 TaxID=1304156 RepID=UPI0033428CCF